MKNYILCKICTKKYKRITPTHLKCHNINMKEYQDKFGYDPSIISCDSLREKYSITKKSMIQKYGEHEGIKRWNTYCQKQSESNTFNYKHKKYGWDKNQFNEYNKSRSITKEHCIQRHGKVKGLTVWNNYCNKQKTAGCTVEWFISKYGEVDGLKKYNTVCDKKALTVDNFIRKYGILGEDKYLEYCNNRRCEFFSKVSQELFNNVFDCISYDKCYYHDYNKEYGVFLRKLNKYTFLDFYVLDNNKAIEFYGDYWHCNPRLYNEDYKHTVYNKTAKDIWDYDRQRLLALKEEHGIDTLLIWENEYIADKDATLDRCLKFLNE